jgi:hypothetical protein
LDIRLKAVEDAIKEQTDSLLGLSKGKYKRPPSHELVPIDDDDDDQDNNDDTQKDVEKGDAHIEKKHPTDTLSSTTPTISLQQKPWWKVW